MADTTRMEFMEHLDRLRSSILRVLAYLVVGMAISWNFRTWIMDLLTYPARVGAETAGMEEFTFHIFEPVGGIMLMLQVSLLGAIIIGFPFICIELWSFIRPALQPREQRAIYILLPSAVVLFAAGIAFCYLVAPRAIGYLLVFNTQLGVKPEFFLQSYLRFFMRLLVVFGLAFETPLVMMFLARIGVVTASSLLATWKWAIVVIAAIAAVVTPTPDPFNMGLVGVPMLLLYFLSVGLTALAERAAGGISGRSKPEQSNAADIGPALEKDHEDPPDDEPSSADTGGRED
ncbi:MAG: twin-arginine translocase subunit TatC [Armatimonadota bacterium]